jgi:hypothetical protein
MSATVKMVTMETAHNRRDWVGVQIS